MIMTFFLLLVIFIAVAAYLSILIVPQQEQYVVERFGKYHTTLDAGLNYIVPFIDQVRHKVTLKDQGINIHSQEAISKDNAVLTVNAIAFIRVVNTQDAVYKIQDYRAGAISICQTSLRSIIGGMDLDEALTKREEIKANLKEAISAQVRAWGCEVITVEIMDIKPSASMQEAMEAQVSAERNRRAVVTTAEGEKRAVITRAEGNLEASRINAEAKIVMAKAEQLEVVRLEAEGIKLAAIETGLALEALREKMGESSIDPATFLLGQQYIEALRELGNSENSKTVVLPPNLIGSVQEILTSKK